MKKIILGIIIFCVFFLQAQASFSIIFTDRIFFENIHTQEKKYMEVRTYKNMFLFQYFFFEAVKEIKIGDQIGENWKVVGHEREDKDFQNDTIEYLSLGSGSLRKGAYSLNLDGYSQTLSLSGMTDVSGMKKLEFGDLDKKMQIQISFEFIKLFFGIGFFVLLPLHFLVYFFLGRGIFYLYEKFGFRIFKNIYINTVLSYFVIYFLQIYYGFSFIELAFGEFMGIMLYPILFITVQGIFLKISLDSIMKFNEKYPNQKVDYLWIIALNVVFIGCYFVGLYIYNNFF